MIDIIYNDFFNCKGFVLDDAYDAYKLRIFFQYYLDNSVEYINCKDIALENLGRFNDLKYLTIPDEAINFNELSNLNDLKGMELIYSQLHYIPIKTIELLEKMILHVRNDTIDFKLGFANLKELKIDGFPGFGNKDLNFISGLRLKQLSITSKKIETLGGIENQQNLENLKIYSCSNLYDISNLYNLKKLRILCLSECNKLKANFVDFLPSSLEKISIFGSENLGPRCRFTTFEFLRKMNNLKVFETNWRISSEQLDLIKKIAPKIEIYKYD